MKIALCWNNPDPLAKITVRHEHYVRGFERLGHQVITVCLAEAAGGFPYEVIGFDRQEDCRRPQFWQALAPDVVVMVTWLSRFEEFAAARQTGAQTIALADSDGQVGLTVHWRHTLYRSVMQHTRLRDRAASAKFFLQRLARRPHETATVIRSIEHSDRVVVNTNVAAENVIQFLHAARSDYLADRVKVCPYPVDPFFSEPLPALQKSNSLTAIGRWDSPQKDGKLLAASLNTYYQRGGTAEVFIFGNGCDVFSELSGRWHKVHPQGVQPPSIIAEALAASRSLLLTSRWESGPIAAFEALCQGCSLVSTDIPNLRELAGFDDRYGHIARRRSPDAFAEALLREMHAWDQSWRDSGEIAAHWRPVFHIDSVCRTLLNSLGVAPILVPSRHGSLSDDPAELSMVETRS